MKISMSILLLLFCGMAPAEAQQKNLIDTALIRFWKSTTMYNESVMMVSKMDELPTARLLFKPDKILSVKNAGLNVEYIEGKDWEYKDNQLRLLKGSKAAYFTEQELHPDSASGTFPGKAGGYILFREGSFFHEHQLAITYTHSSNAWHGPIPVFKKRSFPQLFRKLKRGSLLRLLVFGDSIAAGANASGESNAAPHLPSWGNLIAAELRRMYDTQVDFTNTSVGGKDSRWGLETVDERVNAHAPDLVIIAFGMNDGTSRMDQEVFQENIRGIMDKIKSHNKRTAFILVAPMLPNPESNFTGTQKLFLKSLEALSGPRVRIVDMGGVHEELLKHKSYQDMTGNNINHPNDFLIRWYAQQIAGVLVSDRQLIGR